MKISDAEAGTTRGQLILDDVEFNKTRDNDPKHGIGNDEPQGIRYGNKTYSVSTTAHLNGASAELMLSAEGQDILTATLRTPNLEVNVGKLDWNDVTVEASDDGDVTVAFDFDARQYDENERN
ncbi:hypothetical protein PN494_00170 [Halorubrum ezzemoulense]|nr:hypothetical protein [Halorubrum ezzemoulense]